MTKCKYRELASRALTLLGYIEDHGEHPRNLDEVINGDLEFIDW